jgi:hypothetical protein
MEWDMIPQGTEHQSISLRERFDVVVLERQLIGGMQTAQV